MTKNIREAWVVFGPGFSGQYDSYEEARGVIETNGCGAIFVRIDLVEKLVNSLRFVKQPDNSTE